MLTEQDISKAKCDINKLYKIAGIPQESLVFNINSELGILNGVVHNNQIISTLRGDVYDYRKSVLVVRDKRSKKSKIKVCNITSVRSRRIQPKDLLVLDIRIKDSELSAKTFGLKKAKEKLVGQVFTSYILDSGTSEKLGGETFYVAVPYRDRNIKFCVEDVEFIKPSTKGYNIPKDKTLRKGSKVRIKKGDNKDKYRVVMVRVNKLRFKDSIVQIESLSNPNDSTLVYAKQLKVL